MIKIITLCITTILVSTLSAHTGNTEQNYNAGAPVIEKCYDDPNNPVASQDYSVGGPNIE